LINGTHYGFENMDVMIKDFFRNTKVKRLVSNIFSLSILQSLNYILPLITFPYLVRVLGVEKFGLLAFAQSTSMYFQVISDYGFNFSATREISIYRHDKNKITEIYSSVLIIKFALFFLGLLLLTITVFTFERFSPDRMIYYFYFSIILGNLLTPIWLFQGLEDMKYITYLNILSKGIFTIFIFIFVHQQSDYWLVPCLTSIGALIAGLLSISIIRKKYNIRFQFQEKQKIVNTFNISTPFFISNLAISLYTTTTTFILGLFSSNAIVGFYDAANKVVSALKGIIKPISQATYPYMSNLFISRKAQAKKMIGILAVVIGGITLAVSIGTMIFGKEIIKIVVGEGFEQSIVLLKIMAFIPFIVGLSEVFAVQGLYSIGKQKTVMNFIIKIGLLHILLSTLLIDSFSMIGASISVVISESLITILSIIYFFRETRYYKAQESK
jgi:polysaccharide transporter, PST family